MQIVHLGQNDQDAIKQVAKLLFEGFKEHLPHAWPDIDSAREEVQECSGSDRVSLIAVEENGTILGWVAAAPAYDGHAWELHPTVVHPEQRGMGIGKALVQALECELCERGAVTLFLGTDDENQMTTVGGRDLYPDVFDKLANIKNLGGHPFEFYQRLGFTIVGVIPDANGPGKPDILMAKRLTC